MFQGIANFIRKASQGARLFTWPSRYRGATSGWSETASGALVTPEHALTCSTVAACTRILSETIAALPLRVMRDAEGSRAVEPGHSLADVLGKQPNEFQTSFDFWRLIVVQVLMFGNSYCYIERDLSGQPAQLWPLPFPQQALVEAVDGQLLYRCWSGQQKNTYPARDILHFKGLSLDGLVGRSVLSAAREAIGLALAEQTHAASLFRNSCRPGSLLTVPAGMTAQQRDQFRDSIKTGFAGAMQSGSPLVLPVDAKYQALSSSNTDAQFLESRSFSVLEIARFFRVPPSLVGDMQRVSYSSSESEMSLFASHSIAPWCANFEAELNSKLFPARTVFSARFDLNQLIRGNQTSRYTAYGQALQAGWMSVAEVRAEEGLPFIEGTDKLLHAVNMMPHDPQPAAADGGGDPQPEPTTPEASDGNAAA